MLNCLLLGDSIAVGVAAVVNGGGAVCAVAAHVGATSGALDQQLAAARGRAVTIVSAGSNDPRSPMLDANLLRLRQGLRGGRVVWILPYDRRAAYSVTQVAFRFGDGLVDLARFPSADRVHPNDYRALAAALPR